MTLQLKVVRLDNLIPVSHSYELIWFYRGVTASVTNYVHVRYVIAEAPHQSQREPQTFLKAINR